MKTTVDKDAKTRAMVLKGMEQDRMKLLNRQPFIGTVLMHLELIPVTDARRCPTAMTDGRAVYMGCKFYAKLDLEERLFVLAHETWHCVLLHFVRLQSRDPKRFNIATDLEIHFILSKEKMKEPFVLPHDPAWDGLSAEEIYEKLKSRKRKQPRDPGRCSNGISGTPDGGGFDRHVYKNGSGDADADKGDGSKSSGVAAGKGTGTDDGLGSTGGDGEKTPGGADEKAGGGAGDEPITAEIDEATVENLRRIVIQAAQIAERRQGTLPAHIIGVIEKLRKPELNWKELLKQFVTSCYGGSRRWLPPARRYIGMGLYLQSRREDNLQNIVVAMDISGSMQWNLPLIFGELTSLLKSFGRYNLDVLQCDTEITNVQHFDENHPFADNEILVIRKTGGNCFMPVFDHIKKQRMHPALLIYLTDGYLSTDDYGPPPAQGPSYPVLWILTPNGQAPVPWGKTIKLKGDANEPK